PAVRVEREAACTKGPLRAPQLGAGEAMDAPDLVARQAIESAPATAVPGEVEVTVRAPLRLEHGAAVAAGDAARATGRAVGCNARDIERSAVPGHVGQVPGEEGETAAVRRQPGARVEVAAHRQPGDGAGL